MNVSNFLRRLSSKLVAVVRLLCWRILQPEICMHSGTATVRSDSDWGVANEIFVHGDYDRAILQAIRPDGQVEPLRILDLGANVGFFSLRCIDLYLLTNPLGSWKYLPSRGPRAYSPISSTGSRAAGMKM